MWGNTLVVGAPGESSGDGGIGGFQSDNSRNGAGAVYVFTRTGATWSQQAYIKASNPDANDAFGSAVSLFGDSLVVGSPGESSGASGIGGNQGDNSRIASGAAYVFSRSNSVWAQEAYVKASNTDSSDLFGAAVSISGNHFTVGAPGEGSNASGINGDQQNNAFIDAGAVYVFSRSGPAWTQRAYIKASNPNASDRFGASLSADGSSLAVGAIGEASAATGVDGNQGDNSLFEAGAVYVFNRSGATWTQQAYIKASNSDPSDRFGSSVSIQGSSLLVGAAFENSAATGVDGNQADNSKSSAGAAYLFSRMNGNWTQASYLKASNTDAADDFGTTVSLAGNELAVAAPGEASNTTGIGGSQNDNSQARSGAVYGFEDGDARIGFGINSGLNDAWFNPATPGQGFFVTVYPVIGQIFLAWFTYDTERPPAEVEAILGDPGARWLTAFGPFAGDTAILDIEVTSGGIFDSSLPVPTQSADGTIILRFSGCEFGSVSYDIPSIERQGVIPIERIALDNVALCESL